MTTKKEITNELNRLKQFGFTIVCFNTPRMMWEQQKNFVDYVLFDNKRIVFIEVKIGKDKLSVGQENTTLKLSSCSIFNKNMYMKFIKTLEEAKILVEHLLKGDL